MKLLTCATACVLGLATLCASTARAQNSGPESPSRAVVTDDSAGRVAMENTVGTPQVSPFGPRLNVTGSFGQAPGYDATLFQMNAFFPYHLDPGRSILFESISGSVTDDGKAVGSLGGGYRIFMPDYNRILGISLWGDIDDGHSTTFYRVGVSGESLGKYMDYRLNGYFIAGDDSNFISRTTLGMPVFVGNHIALPTHTFEEFAYGGLDFEMGGPLPVLGRYGINSYIGPYYRHSDGYKDAVGVSLRTQVNVSEDVTVNVRYSNDRIWGAETFATLTWTLPSGPQDGWFKPRRVRDRLADPVIRDTRIPAETPRIVTRDPILNPNDGDPYFVRHIDPDAPPGGNGTFERPFGSVDEFVNDPGTDIIFVTEGTTFPNDLDGQIALFDDQRLLSEAVTHTFLGIRSGGSTVERFILPGFNPLADLPVLTNRDGNLIIAAASNNEVSGFRIDGVQTAGDLPHADGIFSSSTAGFDINRNEFVRTNNAVVMINTGDGLGVFESNSVIGDGQNSSIGFAVRAINASELDLLVGRNTFTNIRGRNEDLDDDFRLDAGEDTNGNGVIDRGTAVEITAANGASIFAADPFPDTNSDGHPDDADRDGIPEYFENPNFQATGILSNTIVNSGQGISLSSVLTGEMLIELHGNNVTNNQGDGLAINANTGGNTAVLVGPLPLTATAAAAAAQVVPDLSNPLTALNFTPDNIFNNNGTVLLRDTATSSGIHVRAFDGGTVIAEIEDTEANDNGFAGLAIEGVEGTIQLVADGNSFNRLNAGQQGVNLNLLDTDAEIGLIANQFFADAELNPTVTFGVGGEASGGELALLIGGVEPEDGNIFIGNVEAAIGLKMSGNPTIAGQMVTFNIMNNTILGTLDQPTANPVTPENPNAGLLNDPLFTGDGINIIGFDNSIINPSLIAENTITGNEGYGAAVQAFDNSTIETLTIFDNEITQNGLAGVRIVRSGNAVIDATVPGMSGVNILDNRINDNFGNGVDIQVQNADTESLPINIASNQILRNGLVGIQLQSQADAYLDVDIVDNLIGENGADGIVYAGTAVGIITGTWAFNDIFDNGQNLDPGEIPEPIFILESGDGVFEVIAGGNGILLFGNWGLNIDPITGLDVIDPLLIANNVIDGNRLDGIDMEILNTLAISSVQDNIIINNLVNGIDVNQASGESYLSFTENLIGINENFIAAGNGGDGIEFRNQDGLQTSFVSENIISYNGTNKIVDTILGGRGIDIINQGSGFSMYLIVGNDVNSNWLSGVYVMNTSSLTQQQNREDDAIQADGDINEVPLMQFRFNDNIVRNNGQVQGSNLFDFDPLGGFNADFLPGLAIRVGTSDSTATIFDPVTGDWTQDNYASAGLGGVVAEVTDNTFGGNFGDDVYIDSFTSTEDPAVTNLEEGVYEPDPLARLDLRFTGNSGDSVDVTNGPIGADIPIGGAFYNNSDQFKSPDPPFDGNDRRRNATRLGAPVAIASGTVASLLYPGTVIDDPENPNDNPSGNAVTGNEELPDFDVPDNAGFFGSQNPGINRTLTFLTGNATGETVTVLQYFAETRRFIFAPPGVTNPASLPIVADDTFQVARVPDLNDFDALVFDGDGEIVSNDDEFEGFTLVFTSGVNDGQQRIINEFFGGVQGDFSAIYLFQNLPAAPSAGDTFDIVTIGDGLGPSTFRVEATLADINPITREAVGLVTDFRHGGQPGFIMDIEPYDGPEDARGVLFPAPGEAGELPFGWQRIDPGTLIFAPLPTFVP